MGARTPTQAALRDASARSPARLALAAVVVALSAPGALAGAQDAQSRETETRVKVAYVFNFPRYVAWPEVGTAGAGAAAAFRLCVVGADPVGDKLQELAGRQVGGRPIEVARVFDPDAGSGCHLLFISASEERTLGQLLKKLDGAPILTVSDLPRFARRGGMIGFVTEDNRVRIEINQRTVREAGLRVGAKVLEIARGVP
jgi:hypothetical protein